MNTSSSAKVNGDRAQDSDLYLDIYKEHSTYIRKIAFRLCHENDLDDLVQEVFIKIFQNIDSFRADSHFKTWAYRITVNTCKDYLRKKSRKSWLSFIDPSSQIDEKISSYQPTDPFSDEWVKKIIETLPIKLREVIVLYSLDDLDIKEIAQVLQIPEGTVKSRLHKSRAILKKKLGKEF